MINRTLLACTVLLLCLSSFGQTVAEKGQNSAEHAADVQQSVSKHAQEQRRTAEKPIKIVKYLDFTKPKVERERIALSAIRSDAVNNSSAVAKSISYTVRGKTYRTISSAENFHQEGFASWYGPGFHGRKTASGEVYDQYAMTAAHKRLPLGTKIKVTNLDNGKSVVVTVNDRGPFHGSRILDLSRAAAEKIGVIHAGIANVSIVAIK